MFMIIILIELCMGKLILTLSISNYCPEFRNGLLDSYFFKLTLKNDCLNFVSGQSFSKPSCLSITKIPVVFKPEL